jgi:hypothetical protein
MTALKPYHFNIPQCGAHRQGGKAFVTALGGNAQIPGPGPGPVASQTAIWQAQIRLLVLHARLSTPLGALAPILRREASLPNFESKKKTQHPINEIILYWFCPPNNCSNQR